MDFIKTPALSAEEGQTLSEYAVILGVIVLAIVGAVGVLSGAIAGAISAVSALL